jgi:transposase
MKMKKLSNTATVANMLRTKPGLKAEDIVKKLKVSKVYAYNLLTRSEEHTSELQSRHLLR